MTAFRGDISHEPPSESRVEAVDEVVFHREEVEGNKSVDKSVGSDELFSDDDEEEEVIAASLSEGVVVDVSISDLDDVFSDDDGEGEDGEKSDYSSSKSDSGRGSSAMSLDMPVFDW